MVVFSIFFVAWFLIFFSSGDWYFPPAIGSVGEGWGTQIPSGYGGAPLRIPQLRAFPPAGATLAADSSTGR